MASPDITLITATWQRPKDLWRLLECVHLQELGTLQLEHLIVHDGPADRATRQVLNVFRSQRQISRRLLELPEQRGQFGAACKDAGLQIARGKAVAFWDDDNWFYPHAITTLWRLLEAGTSVGVAQVLHNIRSYRPLPDLQRWQADGESFRLGNLDTACFMLRTRLAQTGFWFDQAGRGSDYRYFQRVIAPLPPTAIAFEPVVIGVHL